MEILKTVYQDVLPLKSWLEPVLSSTTESFGMELTSEMDPERNLLSTVHVGVSSEVKTSYLTSSQHSNLNEVVLRAVERILKKKLPVQNVLTLGYSFPSTDAGAFSDEGALEIVYPNSCTKTLLSEPWEILLSKIGDSTLLYLLVNTSLFLEVKHSCFVQLSGVPVNKLYENRQILWSKSGTQTKGARVHVQEQTLKYMQSGRYIKRKKGLRKQDKKLLKRNEKDLCCLKNRKKRYEHTDDSKYIKLKKRAEKFAECKCFDTSVGDTIGLKQEVQVEEMEMDDSETDKGTKTKMIQVEKDRFKFMTMSYEKTCVTGRQKRKVEEMDDILSDFMDTSNSRFPAPKRQRMFYSQPAKLWSHDDKVDGTIEDVDDCEIKKTDDDEITTNQSKTDASVTSLDGASDSVFGSDDLLKHKDERMHVCSTEVTMKRGRKTCTMHKDDDRIETGNKSSRKSKTKRGRGRNSQEGCLSFKPFESDLPFPRHFYLYKKNAGEKISKYDLLHNLKMDAQSLVDLYESMFVDTKVLNSGETILVEKPTADECVQSLDKRTVKNSAAENNGTQMTKKSTQHRCIPSIGEFQNKCPGQIPSSGSECVERKTFPDNDENIKCSYINKDNESNKGQQSVLNKETLLKRRKVLLLSNLIGKPVNPLWLENIGKQIKLETVDSNLECSERVNTESQGSNKNPEYGDCHTDTRDVNNSVDTEIAFTEAEIVRKSELSTRDLDQAKEAISTKLTRQTVGDEKQTTSACYRNDNANSIESDLQEELNNKTPLSDDSNCDVEMTDAEEHSKLAVSERDNYQPMSQSSSARGEVLDTIASSNRIPVVVEVLPLLANFIDSHRKCPYRKLLNTICPAVPSAQRHRNMRGRGLGKELPSVTALLHRHTPPRQVFLFLRRCLLKTLPTKLVGCVANRNLLLKNLSKLLSAGRYDKVCLGQLMQGMKTKAVSWLQGVSSNSVKLHLLAKLVSWLVNKYLFTLLRTYFYITDTSFLKYRLLYYRQITWTKIFYNGIHGLLQNNILRPISQDQAMQQVLMSDSLGVSALRFVPKEKSLRPIINMGYEDKQCSIENIPINKQLFVLQSVLSFLKDRNPSLLGHGKLGTNDVYSAWRQYVTDWRKNDQPQLYFVKTDITRCYDSIIQTKLYEIMESKFQKELQDMEVVVRKFVKCSVSQGTVKTKFVREVETLPGFDEDFVTFAKHYIDEKSLKKVILVDKVVYEHETSKSLLDRLRKHLLHNLVKVGGKYYHQQSGISQGSIISTLLCSFYYAEMERQLTNIGGEDFLMRIVDDYMYVTPSLNRAKQFLHQMLQGFAAYNCHTNVEKVLTNFPCQNLPRTSSVWFPWCGLMFNTKTLEVSVDYSRLMGVSIEDTVTYELSSHPGVALQKKILSSASQKCHPIFLDCLLNTPDQVVKNIYLLAQLTAFKLHSYIRKLPHRQRSSSNPGYFLGVVQSIGHLVNWHYIKAQSRSETQVLKLCKDSIMWVCLQAFMYRFQKLPSQYSSLLKQIRGRQRVLSKKLGDKQVQILKKMMEENLTFDFSLMLR